MPNKPLYDAPLENYRRVIEDPLVASYRQPLFAAGFDEATAAQLLVARERIWHAINALMEASVAIRLVGLTTPADELKFQLQLAAGRLRSAGDQKEAAGLRHAPPSPERMAEMEASPGWGRWADDRGAD